MKKLIATIATGAAVLGTLVGVNATSAAAAPVPGWVYISAHASYAGCTWTGEDGKGKGWWSAYDCRPDPRARPGRSGRT